VTNAIRIGEPIIRRIARVLMREAVDETVNLGDGEASDANVERDVRFHELL
jgi:hypothetical protein